MRIGFINPSAQDTTTAYRREIEAVFDRAADRIANGKAVTKPSEAKQLEKQVPAPLQALLRELRDVFPDKLPLASP